MRPRFAALLGPPLPSHSANHRAWESAFELVNNYADRLTLAQLIDCHIAIMAHADRARLEVIALAAAVIGWRT